MEEQVNRLVAKAWLQCQDIPRSKRLLIAIAGIPGSGKTTLAAKVAAALNAKYHESSPGIGTGNDIAAFVPLDGYHLTRAQLSALPDPVTAHARRGAHWTFNPTTFLHLVRALREPLCPETKTLYAPSFDHAVKDPVDDDIAIPAGVRVVVFEGNYLALDKGEWKEAAALMDELWFVEVDFDVARERLARRHAEAGIVETEDEGRKRADENDLVNGREIVDHRLPVSETVRSVEDVEWQPDKQGVEG